MRETAEMFGLNQTTLRFWENEFDILKPYKNAKGTRYFRPEDLKKLHLIYFLLKEERLTIEGAKLRLSNNTDKTMRQFEIVNKLKDIRERLEQMQRFLEE